MTSTTAGGDIMLVVGESVGVDRLREFGAMRRTMLVAQALAFVVAEPIRRKEFEDFPRYLPERDHTAPRSPRRSFKKSSKR